ncbi:hypothetical protein ACM66B_000136 [Microbotryomycetes sp. NB124-2]
MVAASRADELNSGTSIGVKIKVVPKRPAQELPGRVVEGSSSSERWHKDFHGGETEHRDVVKRARTLTGPGGRSEVVGTGLKLLDNRLMARSDLGHEMSSDMTSVHERRPLWFEHAAADGLHSLSGAAISFGQQAANYDQLAAATATVQLPFSLPGPSSTPQLYQVRLRPKSNIFAQQLARTVTTDSDAVSNSATDFVSSTSASWLPAIDTSHASSTPPSLTESFWQAQMHPKSEQSWLDDGGDEMIEVEMENECVSQTMQHPSTEEAADLAAEDEIVNYATQPLDFLAEQHTGTAVSGHGSQAMIFWPRTPSPRPTVVQTPPPLPLLDTPHLPQSAHLEHLLEEDWRQVLDTFDAQAAQIVSNVALTDEAVEKVERDPNESVQPAEVELREVAVPGDNGWYMYESALPQSQSFTQWLPLRAASI